MSVCSGMQSLTTKGLAVKEIGIQTQTLSFGLICFGFFATAMAYGSSWARD